MLSFGTDRVDIVYEAVRQGLVNHRIITSELATALENKLKVNAEADCQPVRDLEFPHVVSSQWHVHWVCSFAESAYTLMREKDQSDKNRMLECCLGSDSSTRSLVPRARCSIRSAPFLRAVTSVASIKHYDYGQHCNSFPMATPALGFRSVT